MTENSICEEYFNFWKWKLSDCLPASKHYFKLFAVLILTYGLISNTLLLLTLTRKKLAKNPNNLFLITIGICGTIAIAIYFGLFILDQVTEQFTYNWIYAWATTLPICYLVCAIHTWSTVCLAGWRVMTLDFPMENSVRMTRKRVMVNIILISAFVIAFHIPHYTNYHIGQMDCISSDPIFRGTKSEPSRMVPEPTTDNLVPQGLGTAESRLPKSSESNVPISSYKTYHITSYNKRIETSGFYIHTIGMQVIPNCLLLLFTLVLLKKLSDARKRKRQLLMAKNGVHNNLSGTNNTSGHQFNRTQSDAAKAAENRQVIETSNALILIFVVSLICDLPISIKIVADLIMYPDMDKVIFTNIGYICNIMKLLNCSMVLVLCSITSSLFRTTFMEVLHDVSRVIFCSRFTGCCNNNVVIGDESIEFQTITTASTALNK